MRNRKQGSYTVASPEGTQLRKAVLVVHLASHFTELVQVARLLKRFHDYDPVLLFASSYPTLKEDLAVCHAEGIACLDGKGTVIRYSEVNQANIQSRIGGGGRKTLMQRLLRVVNRLPGPLQRLLRVLWHWYASSLVRTPHFLRQYSRHLNRARRILSQQKPDILIFPEDNVGYAGSIGTLIKAGHEYGIPSVIVPYTIANALEPAEAYYHKLAHNLEVSLRNRLVGAFYPNWVYEHKDRKLLRLPANRALAIEWLGLAPPLPWIVNSGFADAVAVKSDFMYRYYEQAGLPSNKLVLTGGVTDDVLARNLQNVTALRMALCEELGLQPDRFTILCALPPDQLPRAECEFETYDELVQFWVQSLSSIGDANVIIRLHPRVVYEEMLYLKRWGAKLTQKDTAELIPLCDVFVASVSATIQWAIACGKPAVNYDVYRYRYNDYVEASGVITVEEKEDFVATIRRLTHDPAFYAETTARQAVCKEHWGQLDGQAATRMLHLFDQLIADAKGEDL